MRVHAGGKALLAVLLECIGCHGDDGDGFRLRSVERADALRGGQTVQHGHHHIHQDSIECARRGSGKRIERLLSVAYGRDLGAAVGQQERGDLHVELVVLDNEQMHPVDVRLRRRDGFGRGLVDDLERDNDREAAAFPEPALHRDGAAHLFDDLLDDGHTEAGARIARARGLVGLHERREQMVLDEVLGHTEAGILNAELAGDAVGGPVE